LIPAGSVHVASASALYATFPILEKINLMTPPVSFSRNCSVAELIGRLIQSTEVTLDAALYRFNNPQLAGALAQAARRGVSIRLVLDRGKYHSDPVTQRLLQAGPIPFRLLAGRPGPESKMHHKFAILDGRAAITGSYNWTLESEEENYENLLVLHGLEQLAAYRREFELLWEEAGAALRTELK
jgi:phosphatidylserine/phosphatidylglycerophosphate/cardiolipin synthase-like enzyme